MRTPLAFLALTTFIASSAAARAEPIEKPAVRRFADVADNEGSTAKVAPSPAPAAVPTTPAVILPPTPVEPSTQPGLTPNASLPSEAPRASAVRRDDGPSSGAMQWYGGQTLAMDGVALGALILGGVVVSGEARASGGSGIGSALMVGGLLTYAAGAPIVHGAHGRVGAALGSAGLRIALPSVGAAVAASFVRCPQSADDYFGCGFSEAFAGMAIGAVGAMVLDSALLAWEPAPKPRPGEVSWMLAPTADPKRGSAGLSVTGSF